MKTLKPVSYEREPRTLGQHLKKRRLELGLRQRDVQARFNLDKDTYANWEKGRCYPAMRHWPGIIAFLQFDPHGEPGSIGEALKAHRRRRGLSRKTLAAMIPCDEATLWKWEDERRTPAGAMEEKVVSLLRQWAK